MEKEIELITILITAFFIGFVVDYSVCSLLTYKRFFDKLHSATNSACTATIGALIWYIIKN